MSAPEAPGSRRIRLAGRRVTLLGLGARTHVELARYLVRRGAIVTITDRKPAADLELELDLLGDLPVRLSLGGHKESDVLGADLVFVSPGVPRDLPLLAAARRRGVPLSSEVELLFSECRSPMVGITGSSGKTTTTSLVGAMFQADGRQTFVGGNIGVPLINRLDEIGANSWAVLELSSFQLEALAVSPTIGAILNVTENHLDRHLTMEAYVRAKLNVVRHQRSDELAVLGLDDQVAASLAPKCGGRVAWFSRWSEVEEGVCLVGPEIVLRSGGTERVICRSDQIQLRGSHNLLNVLAAAAIAGAAGVSSEAIAQTATSFAGVEHRLEFVRAVGEVAFYDDSIATAPERTCAALQSFDQPIVLIAGGRSKHLSLAGLARLVVERCRAVVTFGEMAEEVEAALRDGDTAGALAVRRAGDLDSAVLLAWRLARPGDVVLLSPGGTSFDAFRDFEARGTAFKEIVRGLSDGD